MLSKFQETPAWERSSVERPDWLFDRDDDPRGIPRQLAEGITTRVFSGPDSMLSIVRIQPHSDGRTHSHAEEQWGILLEGECTRIQDGQEAAVRVGDFWHTPGSVPHGIRTGDQAAVVLDVFSPPREEYRSDPAASAPATKILDRRPVPSHGIAELDAALLADAAGPRAVLPPTIRPVSRHARVEGPAFTVSCPPHDNLWLHRAIYEASPGDVLVATTAGCREAGYWGELLTHAALARGLGGLVIDGCIRDSRPLERLQFPVFATGRCLRRATKNDSLAGALGCPIQIGDCTIEAGDLVVGDSDGVVVIGRDGVTSVLDQAHEFSRVESELVRRLTEGARTLDLLALT
jgi:4-hydroxy-4-methyl-2-oxoglutarate aldolase